ncbi:hypothetical protein PSQ90_15705 [Devosia rhodophyticola]|uniref:PepSY domain-containing protein n=1 Tax=Devosia rhodophyticola TaxID=3026423 RepID=A0ABY7YWY1_9HYPH|nr:hypothetical protein [Devosia rhodophyticola]WDR05682.1 hypothetical protein PSQ90_15705 [Devosia rhodophyticola]
MSHNRWFLPSKLRLTAVAAGLCGIALLIQPTAAQSRSPAFGFQFQPPMLDGDFLGDPRDFDYRAPQLPMCLTDRQIRDEIAARGYSAVALNVPNDKRIQVRAVKDGWIYLLNFNFCTNQIEGRTRLRSASRNQ